MDQYPIAQSAGVKGWASGWPGRPVCLAGLGLVGQLVRRLDNSVLLVRGCPRLLVGRRSCLGPEFRRRGELLIEWGDAKGRQRPGR